MQKIFYQIIKCLTLGLLIISVNSLMGQTEFYVYLQDAAGISISNGVVNASQDGKPVEELLEGEGYKVYSIDPKLPLHLSAKHPDYEIDPQSFQPPHQLYSTVMTGGKEGDAFLRLDGSRRYFISRPDLIVLVSEPSAWHTEKGYKTIAAWAETFGLEETQAPWEVRGLGLDGETQIERHFYQKMDHQPFLPYNNQALHHIRKTDLTMVAGIPLWENAVLGNVFETSASDAPEDWLKKNGICLTPQQVSNGPILLTASGEIGLGIVDLYEKLVQSGHFENLIPQIFLLH